MSSLKFIYFQATPSLSPHTSLRPKCRAYVFFIAQISRKRKQNSFEIGCQTQHFLTMGHIALDQSSWSSKSVFNLTVCYKMQWLERCFKSRIQITMIQTHLPRKCVVLLLLCELTRSAIYGSQTYPLLTSFHAIMPFSLNWEKIMMPYINRCPNYLHL